MTKIKIVFLTALFTAMLVSCSLFPDINQKPNGNLDTPLEENEFYAQNMKTGKYYKVKSRMMYEGDKCVIWAEEGSGITQDKAEKIAGVYDTDIRPKITETFSKKNFNFRNEKYNEEFDDMLDFANWLADRDDRKLTILLLDIKDNFKNPKTDSYVAGYFFGGNFDEKGKRNGGRYYSNSRDMIYVDTYPGLEMKPRQTYATFAHELQHLINFVTTVQTGRYLMDTWVDEGLSSQAEYLYLEENPPEKCEWFKNDRDGTIAKGNNFFVWDNHREEPLAILDDYATVYLFFRWLYLQANTELQSHIFIDIETSNDIDYKAVTNVARQINPAWGDWETLLGTWLAANYYPKNSYGYIGDDYLQKTITVKPVAGQTISLYPGEGVYSIIKGSFSIETNGNNNNIRYAELAGKVLLTFNANTDNRLIALPEIVVLTGVSPLTSQTTTRTIQTGTLTGPYVIDARDMLNRAEK